MDNKHRSWKSYFLGIVLMLMGVVLGSSAMLAAEESAQGGGIPPLPAVYHGQVYLDGKLYEAADHELTVKIGDWEGRSAPIVNGSFENLIAGPPNIGYVGMDTTFHLGELVAVQAIPFSMLTEPSFEPLRLDFKSASAQEMDAGSQPAEAVDAIPGEAPVTARGESKLEIPWLTLILLFAGGGILVVILNRLGKLLFK